MGEVLEGEPGVHGGDDVGGVEVEDAAISGNFSLEELVEGEFAGGFEAGSEGGELSVMGDGEFDDHIWAEVLFTDAGGGDVKDGFILKSEGGVTVAGGDPGFLVGDFHDFANVGEHYCYLLFLFYVHYYLFLLFNRVGVS